MIYDDLSLKEAAVLSGAPEKTIRHELAARVVRASRSGRRRRFGPREVVYFSLVNGLPVTLDKAQRKDLFELLAANKERLAPREAPARPRRRRAGRAPHR
jgi:hypothetical protein